MSHLLVRQTQTQIPIQMSAKTGIDACINERRLIMQPLMQPRARLQHQRRLLLLSQKTPAVTIPFNTCQTLIIIHQLQFHLPIYGSRGRNQGQSANQASMIYRISISFNIQNKPASSIRPGLHRCALTASHLLLQISTMHLHPHLQIHLHPRLRAQLQID